MFLFSICLDESTDIHNLSQLVIYIRTVNNEFEVFEDFFCSVAFDSHVNGEKIWETVNTRVFSYVSTSKLSSVCTDGANVMTGKNKGFVGFLLKNGVKVPSFHCSIHQHALLGKELNLTNAMKTAILIINKIKGGHNALTHRKFKSFLQEIESDYGDLLLFTEVRWLSRGRSLARLFELRNEVLQFFKENPSPDKDVLIASLENNEFLLELSFLSDISDIINTINLQLQGKNKYIFDSTVTIFHFGKKLSHLESQVQNNNLASLPKTAKLYCQSPIPTKIAQFKNIIHNLSTNFAARFHDFDQIRGIIDLHNNTLACNMEELSQPLREEIQKILTDFDLPCTTGKEFWRNVNVANYPHSKEEILKLYSIFPTTYNCETTF